METTTKSAPFSLATSISDRCPGCRKPIVGTSPMVASSGRAARVSSMVWVTSKRSFAALRMTAAPSLLRHLDHVGRSVQTAQLLGVGHVERLRLLVGETPGADVVEVMRDGRARLVAEVGVAADELRGEVVVEAEEIVEDQHLPVAVRAGADADGRRGDALGDHRRQLGGAALQHDGEAAGLSEGH